ncbi:hypothetical protein P7C70_g3814, partial [Phenoliferia sp. Uapishka_3]
MPLNKAHIAAVVAAAAWYATEILGSEPIPQSTSTLTGKDRTAELLAGSDKTFHTTMRMSKVSFRALLDTLELRGGLQASRYIDTDEMLMVFLWMIATASASRILGYLFQHSTDTISSIIQKVLRAIIHPDVQSHYITLPTSSLPIPSEIFHNSKFYPYFKDCLGALLVKKSGPGRSSNAVVHVLKNSHD